VAEHLVSVLGDRYQVALDKMALFDAINELSANQVIDHSLRSDLHAIRKAGNAVVHSGQQGSPGGKHRSDTEHWGYWCWGSAECH
jgi:hypothetical protein